MNSPFQQALGNRFGELPTAVQRFHLGGRFNGRVSVEHGPGMVAVIARRLANLPSKGSDMRFEMTVIGGADGERWERDFGGHLTHSELRWNPATGMIDERLGQCTCTLLPSLREGVLEVAVPSVKLLGVTLPGGLAPRSTSREWQDREGRFRFDIAAGFGTAPPLVRYHGWLMTQA